MNPAEWQSNSRTHQRISVSINVSLGMINNSLSICCLDVRLGFTVQRKAVAHVLLVSQEVLLQNLGMLMTCQIFAFQGFSGDTPANEGVCEIIELHPVCHQHSYAVGFILY